jgi:hypothetical protein
MENSHNFTLNEAAKETGRSKVTISKAFNNGKLSYISKTKSGYQIEPYFSLVFASGCDHPLMA